MPAITITPTVASVGVLNPTLRVFDIVMNTEFGTSYNSYVIRGKEKTALVECSHLDFFDNYLANIGQICDPQEIDYIILNHNEPDHSGALAKLLDVAKNAQVVVSKAGGTYLKNITNRTDLNLLEVKDGDTLDLGERTLKFLIAPNLHWPDSMFTWDEQEGILFSCDFLGCHYCAPEMLDTTVQNVWEYDSALAYYYKAIFGPFPGFVAKGLQKIKDLPIHYVCPSHGPVLTKEGNLSKAIACYEEWSQPVESNEIPVFYVSAYGNTKQLAEAIAQGIRQAKPGHEVQTYDIIQYDMAMLGDLLNRCKAFAIGSPTINRDAVQPVWELLSHVDAVNCPKKPCLVFGSYGWSGEAIPNLIARLTNLKMAVYADPCRGCFVPTQEDLERAKVAGETFAQGIQ